VVFHLLFNGAQVVLSRVDAAQFEQGIGHWFFSVERSGDETDLRFDWPLLSICVVLSALIISWLLRQRPKTLLPKPPGSTPEPVGLGNEHARECVNA
jgi:hypothetical protein